MNKYQIQPQRAFCENLVAAELVTVKTASWERANHSTDSFAVLIVEKHIKAGWAQIRLREHGSKSSKETATELSPEQITELIKLLQS